MARRLQHILDMQMLSRFLPFALVVVGGCEPAADFGSLIETDHAPKTSTLEANESGFAVGSVGYVQLAPDIGPIIPALHVRVAIWGQAATASADAASARLETSAGSLAPIAINANVASLPVVIADPETRQLVDFYFPTPAPGDLAFAWSFATPKAPLAVRAAVQPGVDAGWGPQITLGAAKRWWFAPDYAWTTLRHEDGVIATRPPTTARVHGLDEKEPIETECDEW